MHHHDQGVSGDSENKILDSVKAEKGAAGVTEVLCTCPAYQLCGSWTEPSGFIRLRGKSIAPCTYLRMGRVTNIVTLLRSHMLVTGFPPV